MFDQTEQEHLVESPAWVYSFNPGHSQERYVDLDFGIIAWQFDTPAQYACQGI